MGTKVVSTAALIKTEVDTAAAAVTGVVTTVTLVKTDGKETIRVTSVGLSGAGSGTVKHTWGNITGNIVDQIDLQAELDNKEDKDHVHVAADVPYDNTDVSLGSDDVQAAITELDTNITNNTSSISIHSSRVDNPHSVTYAQLPDVPTTFPPSTHNHALVDISDSGSMASENDAPSDSLEYVRKDASWVQNSGGAGNVPEAPIDGLVYARKDSSWIDGTLVFAGLVHTHVEADTTDLDKYTKNEVDTSQGIQDTSITTVTNDLTTHENNVSNPHAVTYAQLGGTAPSPQVHAASHYAGGSDILPHGNLSGAGSNSHTQIDSHIADVSNPHAVTAAQIGASQNVVEDITPQLGGNLETLGNKLMISTAGSALLGVVGDTSTADGVFFAYSTDGIYDAANGAILADVVGIELRGTSAGVASLAGVDSRQ